MTIIGAFHILRSEPHKQRATRLLTMTRGGIASPLRDPPRPRPPVLIKPPPTFQCSLRDSVSQGCSSPRRMSCPVRTIVTG